MVTNGRGAPLPIVAIGSSAGGINALRFIAAELPHDLPAAILVVQHLDPVHTSVLADLLARVSALPVHQATMGAAVRPGEVLVAPPNQHLTLDDDRTVALDDDPRIHFVRPSVDVLFRSVARVSSSNAIGVVLSGGGSDGADGVRAIKAAGGTVIAQDESSSEVFGMPGAAIATGDVDLVLPLEDIPRAIDKLVRGS
jgi:two-component system chemotaxis response regulator CheB